MHIEQEIFYFRLPLHQRPYVLYSKSLVFYTNNPAFPQRIIAAAFTFVSLWHGGSTYIAVTYTYCTQVDLPDRLSDIKADSDKLLYTGTLSFAFTVMNSFPSATFFFFLLSLPVTGCRLPVELDLLR